MRSDTKKRTSRPLTHEDFELEPSIRIDGGKSLNGIVEKASLKDVSLEERRREAKKPLYLVRYE